MASTRASFPPSLSLLLLAAVAGCRPAVIFIPSSPTPADHGDHVTERKATAIAVGCDAKDVVIRDHLFGFWKSSWAARCNEQTYRCEVSFRARCEATSEPLPARREHDEKVCDCRKDG